MPNWGPNWLSWEFILAELLAKLAGLGARLVEFCLKLAMLGARLVELGQDWLSWGPSWLSWGST